MPHPILSESLVLNPVRRATDPHPITFAPIPTKTNARENRRILELNVERSFWIPILAKKTGPKIMYELISIFLEI